MLELANPSSATDLQLVKKLVLMSSRAMGISGKVYAGLSNSYFATGSFIFYKTFGSKPQNEYYIIGLDFTDPAIMWPLVCHEVAHCKLSESNLVSELVSSGSRHIDDAEKLEAQIEEALCDSIATRMSGKIFPLAFAIKFWGQIPTGETGEHPSNSFRLELMARTLEDMGMFEEAADLRDAAVQSGAPSWDDGSIAGMIEEIVEGARTAGPDGPGVLLASTPGSDILSRCWTSIYRDNGLTQVALSGFSHEYKRALEGRPMPPDTGS